MKQSFEQEKNKMTSQLESALISFQDKLSQAEESLSAEKSQLAIMSHESGVLKAKIQALNNHDKCEYAMYGVVCWKFYYWHPRRWYWGLVGRSCHARWWCRRLVGRCHPRR